MDSTKSEKKEKVFRVCGGIKISEPKNQKFEKTLKQLENVKKSLGK